MQQRSRIYLVGAGPGDPDLLTVRALRLLKKADTVIYDRLVSDEILRLAPAAADRIYVGKATGRHTLDQAAINELLVKQAAAGRIIIRLKGGDPCIFGRGSEEALALVRHGIAFEIVPGITAAQACATTAGIPLTHRGLASGVRFITGHRSHDDELVIDTQTLADTTQTLVIYMGLGNLSAIVSSLLVAGRQPSTPAAIIERISTPRQRNHYTTVGSLTDTARSRQVEPPALIVVGDVVSLAAQLGNSLRMTNGERECRYA